MFDVGAGTHYDVAKDGRFLMLKNAAPASDAAATPLIVVQNWHEELRRLAPVNDRCATLAWSARTAHPRETAGQAQLIAGPISGSQPNEHGARRGC